MSNPQWTIDSIPLDFEGYHSFLLACAHCRLPLLPLAALDAYLRLRHAPTLQLSAFFLAPADAPALTAYLQLEALEVAVAGPFLLCQVGSIRCRNCGKSVGHRLGRTTPEHRQLADSLLIDLDKLHDSPHHPGLKQSVKEQSELALQTASPSPRPTASLPSAAYLQQTIAKSIENIGFFGARVTEVEMRVEKLGQICGML